MSSKYSKDMKEPNTLEYNEKENLVQKLSEALEHESRPTDTHLEPWVENFNVMKELFKKLPADKLSQQSQDKLFKIVEEAWLVFFEKNPQERQRHIQQLYRALVQVPMDEFSKTMGTFHEWLKAQNETMNEEDLFVGLQIYARIAKECDEQDFITAFDKNELPPMELSHKEMEMLHGGVRLVNLKNVLLKLPKSFTRF